MSGEIYPYASLPTVQVGRSYGLRLADIRRTWEAGRTIGRAAKRYLARKRESFKSKPKSRGKRLRGGKKPAVLTGLVENDGTGGQLSKFRGRTGMCFIPQSVLDSIAHEIYVTNVAGQTLAGIGLQSVATIAIAGSPADFDAISSSSKVADYFLEDWRMEVDITNCYLANCSLAIYDVVARKDIASTTLVSPSAAWVQGTTDESSSAAYDVPGSTPFQVELFNQYYKVVQVTQVTLGGGNMHKHIMTAKPQRLIRGAYAAYTPEAFKDVTHWLMIVISGAPANDTVSTTQVTLGKGGVNWVYRKQHRWKPLQNNSNSVTVSSNLLTSFTTAEDVVNTGGSTITTNMFG